MNYREILLKIDDDTLIGIYNFYENEFGYGEVMSKNTFDEMTDTLYLYESNISEILRALEYGNHDWQDEYVYVNAYGNFESFNNIYEIMDIDDIAQQIESSSEFKEYVDDILAQMEYI